MCQPTCVVDSTFDQKGFREKESGSKHPQCKVVRCVKGSNCGRLFVENRNRGSACESKLERVSNSLERFWQFVCFSALCRGRRMFLQWEVRTRGRGKRIPACDLPLKGTWQRSCWQRSRKRESSSRTTPPCRVLSMTFTPEPLMQSGARKKKGQFSLKKLKQTSNAIQRAPGTICPLVRPMAGVSVRISCSVGQLHPSLVFPSFTREFEQGKRKEQEEISS